MRRSSISSGTFPEYKNIEEYWPNVARYINRKYFSEPDNFFKDAIVQSHIANPDFIMGEIIVKYLWKTDYGNKILRLYSDSIHCNPVLMPQFPSISPTTASHLANLYSIYEKLSLDILSQETIKVVDFGGGYGGFARLLLTLSENIQVTIIDMQEMLDIQYDFISKTTKSSNRLFMETSIDKISRAQIKSTLFNASFSLSETTKDFRDLCIDYIYLNCDNFFIIYQNEFHGIGNDVLMVELANHLKDKFEIRSSFYGDWMNANDAMVVYGKLKNG
jgi:hypothetical protein